MRRVHLLVLDKYVCQLLLLINLKLPHPFPLLEMLERDLQDAEPIFNTPAQIYRRCFGEILGWAGDFGDLETGIDYLREHLVVEDEVVGVSVEVDRF